MNVRGALFGSLLFGFAGGACDGMVETSGDEPAVVSGALGAEKDLVPNGKGHVIRGDAGQGQAQPSGNGKPRPNGNGISYHNGPVMTSPITLYYIWYGDWSTNTSAQTILTDLAQNLGGSPYWNINTTYNNGTTPVSSSVAYGGSTDDAYSLGKALTDANIQTIVSSAISAGKLPKDANGIYFVLTSADVNATSGFCSQYCGWHTHGTIAGTDIKYSFVGNPDRCPTSCAQQTVGPNGNAGADGMASILVHEAEEAATDPDLNAWYDQRGYENADKCAWTFGNTYTVNGALANVKLGQRDYLIQRNWVNANGGYCAMQYP